MGQLQQRQATRKRRRRSCDRFGSLVLECSSCRPDSWQFGVAAAHGPVALMGLVCPLARRCGTLTFVAHSANSNSGVTRCRFWAGSVILACVTGAARGMLAAAGGGRSSTLRRRKREGEKSADHSIYGWAAGNFFISFACAAGAHLSSGRALRCPAALRDRQATQSGDPPLIRVPDMTAKDPPDSSGEERLPPPPSAQAPGWLGEAGASFAVQAALCVATLQANLSAPHPSRRSPPLPPPVGGRSVERGAVRLHCRVAPNRPP